ncbi:Plant mobile domain family [Salix suchowensis]|nr:Plant mobile domain family [Salix suchowensis]
MVLFKNSSSSTKRFLVIEEKYCRTSLRVYEPAIGPFAKKLPSESIKHLTSWSSEASYELHGHGDSPQSVLQLQSSFPHSTNFLADLPSLDYHKHDGNATCKDYFPISDALEYTPKYWEWTEDILKHYEPILERMNVILSFYNHWNPATNTLSTPNGEESISLWELTSCSSLPIFGTFYDEVVPSADELNEADKKGHSFLPKSCKYLFIAFHKECQTIDGDHVMTLQDWVDFWFRDDLRYKVPFPVGKSSGFNKTNYPSGSIDKSRVRSSKFICPFKELNVPSHIRDEVYLAAFLSCWLCKFVFPSKDVGFIRPSTFKVASMMAAGRQFSLAIPVLASIFKGLKEVQSALGVAARDIPFPIHFLSSWLAEKFGTHQTSTSPTKLAGMTKYASVGLARHFNESQAHALFRDPKRVISPVLLPLTKVGILYDNGNLPILESDYFMCIRSGYLTLRYDDTFIIEPYCPDRFTRQFGFCQHIPRDFGGRTGVPTLEDVSKLWHSFTKLKTHSRCELLLPSNDNLPLVTKRYMDWWTPRWSKVCSLKTKIIFKSPANVAIVSRRPKEKKNDPLLTKRKRSSPTYKRDKRVVDVDSGKEESTRTSAHINRTSLVIPSVKRVSTSKDYLNKKSFNSSGAKERNLGNDFDMYIGPKMSVASVASPNPFNILAAGIGNSQPSFSLPHEQPNPPQPIFNVATNLHNLGPTTAFEPSGITRYCADDIIGEIRSEFAIKCWESVRNKIARTPIHYIPDLAGEVEKILLSIEDIKVDCYSIRRMVTEVIEDAKKFIHLESSLSPMMTSEQRALDVEKLEVQLKNSEAFEEEASTSISITHAEITKITGQLMELQSKKTELESSLKACDEKLSKRKIITSGTRAEITTLSSSPVINEADAGILQKLKGLLETKQKEMEGHNWKL